MPENKLAILLSFSIGALLEWLQPSCFPSLHINFLIAPLIFSIYSFSLPATAWLALFSGLFLDFLLLSPRIGCMAMSYLISLFFLFRFRHYFFKDALSTPLLMTIFFSFLVQLSLPLLASLFGFHFQWHLLQSLFIPLKDCLSAFLLFLLPRNLMKNYTSKKYAS